MAPPLVNYLCYYSTKYQPTNGTKMWGEFFIYKFDEKICRNKANDEIMIPAETECPQCPKFPRLSH